MALPSVFTTPPPGGSTVKSKGGEHSMAGKKPEEWGLRADGRFPEKSRHESLGIEVLEVLGSFSNTDQTNRYF